MTQTQVHLDEAEVAAALWRRDLCYGAMRRAVPDLEKPVTQRAPLSVTQQVAVTHFLLAEDRLRAARSVTLRRDPVAAAL